MEETMRIPRRQFLQLAGAAAAAPVLPQTASALDYPTRPVRLLGQALSERLGQPFIIVNRSGASGTIATDSVVRAPPDGRTLLLDASSDAYNSALYSNLKFNFIRDIAPVASIALTPGVMEVHPSFPAKTVPEFIVYAKANPGRINFASAGNGTPQHVFGEMFKMMAGVDMVHVPYCGGAPAVGDLVGGQVQVMFDAMPSSIEHIRAGRLRALAVTTAKRSEALPDVPTVGDFLPGFEANIWFGVGAPKNTPSEILDTLNREINASLDDPRMKTRLSELGAEVLAGSRADFVRLTAEDAEKWTKVIRAPNIRAE
jgi:tripartite-type tricarboxylate transporter receptor subunit TctC